MKPPPVSKLEAAIRHQFRRPDLLQQALTHPSASSSSRPDNQRLEFLGDRVLGLTIAQALMEAYPDAQEGDLAPRFNALVRRETLAEVAESIGLGQHLHLGRSESTSGGRRKGAILADAMEAVIAALYIDGGMEAATTFIHAEWDARIAAVDTAPTDPKTAIQEWAQGRGLALPSYALISRTGPDHAPEFVIEISLENGATATGKAGSKKQAEQTAAEALLKMVAKND